MRSYVVLDNHFHLLMKQKTLTPYVLGKVKLVNRKAAERLLADPTNPDLYSLFISDLYKAAFQEFSTLYNQKHKRKGHVIQQRFKRKQIDLLNVPYLIAYIHNNPRHHGMVKDVDLYDSCSHSDKAFQSWVREFGKKAFAELSEGNQLYYRLLEVVNKIKMREIGKVPDDIWTDLHSLLGSKKKDIRNQTKHLINFDRKME
jgi:hypothetical protein